MKRKIYDKLLEWKKWAHGETALMIEGARRVGKRLYSGGITIPSEEEPI